LGPDYEDRSVQLTSNLRHRINNLLEIMPRQALHAKCWFSHHHQQTARFESDLPDDMKALIEKLFESLNFLWSILTGVFGISS
jgi:hypothetical protein